VRRQKTRQPVRGGGGKFMRKWKAAAEKGTIKTLESVHLENVLLQIGLFFSPQESAPDSCHSFSFK
jgi:hypothetical protein